MIMTKVRNVFYKPKWFDGKSLDNTIDVYTRLANYLANPAGLELGLIERCKLLSKLSCSHVENWSPDEDGEFINIQTHYNFIRNESSINKFFYGQMFTSTMRQNAANGNTDGIVMRPASDILTHPERWMYSEFDVPKAALDYSMAWCKEMVDNNKGYDKKDIYNFFKIDGKKRIQDINDGKLICSGATWAAMYKIWEWCKKNVLLQDDKDVLWYRILAQLFKDRDITNIMSPLLLAIWEYQIGVHFYEVKDGRLIL